MAYMIFPGLSLCVPRLLPTVKARLWMNHIRSKKTSGSAEPLFHRYFFPPSGHFADAEARIYVVAGASLHV